MCNVAEVADAAEVIVNGYAFTKFEENIKVLNLKRPDKAALISKVGEVLETSMDDVELDIVLDYYKKNQKYMFIKDNYKEMYIKWSEKSDTGFFCE